MRRGRVGIALAMVAAALVAPSGGGVGGAVVEARPGDRYVALGDSFTAGPLIPTPVAPLGCLKSNRNYPRVVNATLGGAGFTDVSCSGAATRDMFSAQPITGGDNPAQLSALSASTALVTIGVGGNDIGFTEIIQNCSTLNPFDTPCRDEYTAGGVDEITRRINATAPNVSAVLSAITQRAPNARVFVVGYPQILPDRGRGCWPTLPIAFGDVAYLREKARELNAMLASRARLAGIGFIDTYGPSEGHSACASPSTRWVEPLVPANLAAPVHPNARGMAGIAAIVAPVVS